MKSLVIGAGQIGTAIYQIIKDHHEAHLRDVADMPLPGVDVLHICFPDGPFFEAQVRKYIGEYKPALTLIHSSVKVGTTEKLGDGVVNCPVRGRHPHLAQEIPAFQLFVAGCLESDTIKAQEYLESCGLVIKRLDDPGATELCKLLSNIHMGLEIAWRQEVERILRTYGVSSSVYDAWEDSYNLGYRVTGDEQLIRPRLRPDPIGGHCILECIKILKEQYLSRLFDFIEESNEKAKASRTSNEPGDPALVPGPEAA